MIGRTVNRVRRERRRQHADEMHRPDADPQECRRAREQQTPACSRRRADARRKTEAGVAAQGRDHH